MATTSMNLRTKLAIALPALSAPMRQFWSASPIADRYVEYLHMMYSIVRASVPLMESALRQCRYTPEDPLSARLARYFTDHIVEEAAHDRWLLEDLNLIDVDGSHLSGRFSGVEVAELVGAQYYWLHHRHPICLLGYIAVLESKAPNPSWIGMLAERTGYPRQAFRTLAHHAEADAEHTRELFELLDELPLTRQHDEAIGESTLYTVARLAAIFQGLANSSVHEVEGEGT